MLDSKKYMQIVVSDLWLDVCFVCEIIFKISHSKSKKVIANIMFESDDFDQVLSQFELPDVCTIKQQEPPIVTEMCGQKENSESVVKSSTDLNNSGPCLETAVNKASPTPQSLQTMNLSRDSGSVVTSTNFVSPKDKKRKIIHSLFDTKSKRKFPGPAGLLSGTLEDSENDSIGHLEFLSQDVDFSQNYLRRDLFESPLWVRLIDDSKKWSLSEIQPIQTIKQMALAGSLRRRKAQTVAAFVESVDRSAIDPLVVLRDSTGSIKCTLLRDAWSSFSTYIVSEYCALVLWQPTVLITGSTSKKHYLNITMSNIFAIYSSAIIDDDDKLLPDGYAKKTAETFSIIKKENSLGPREDLVTEANDGADWLDGLDSLIFSDDIF